MSGDIPISIDDPEKDEGIIREKLVDELCKGRKISTGMVDHNDGASLKYGNQVFQPSLIDNI